MKDLKYENQSIFPLCGRSNFILGIGTETIYLSTKWVHYVEEPIPAPLCLHGWVIGGFMGWWVGVDGVGGVVVMCL